jgi:alpha-L-fucosidase
MVYEIQPQILNNSRIGNYMGDFWIPGDNIIPEENMKYWENYQKVKADMFEGLPWETPGTMNNTWGYKSDDKEWKSTEELLYWLTTITSKGGNYLLNIGPTGDGLFPEECLKRLKDIGEWMRIHGESVYGTTKWLVNHEGPVTVSIGGTESREEKGFNANFTPQDFWFSQKENHIFVTSLKWPENYDVSIESMNLLTKDEINKIETVQLLGCDEKISWAMTEKGFTVTLPADRPNSYGYVLKISFKQERKE